jgi:hypothetical protein
VTLADTSVKWKIAIEIVYGQTGFVSTLINFQAAFQQAGIHFIHDDEMGGFGRRLAEKSTLANEAAIRRAFETAEDRFH